MQHQRINSLWDGLWVACKSNPLASSCSCSPLWPSHREFLFSEVIIVDSGVQMIAGRSAPVFPRWIADRSLPTKHLLKILQHRHGALNDGAKMGSAALSYPA
jgi:hypothetical protein